MIEPPRRKFLAGIGAVICAPAIVRAASLMPVKVIEPVRIDLYAAANAYLTPAMITRQALMILHRKLDFIGAINRGYDDAFASAFQFNSLQSPLHQGMNI